MRRIVCKNVNNMRDLGGYLNKEGTVTKFNRFIRSNLPIGLERTEIDYLKKIGITTIIDLRSKEEAERCKCQLNTQEFEYYNISLNGNKKYVFEEQPQESYMKVLENKQEIYQIFKIIVQSKGAILYHCTAGKDRTGIISMLLLLLANVYEDDIITDYEVSYTYLRNIVRQMHLDDPSLPAYIGLSKMETMEQVLEQFFQKYNNIHTYLKNIGLTDNDLKIIKDKLLK